MLHKCGCYVSSIILGMTKFHPRTFRHPGFGNGWTLPFTADGQRMHLLSPPAFSHPVPWLLPQWEGEVPRKASLLSKPI